MIFGHLASYALLLALIVLGYALVAAGAGLLLGSQVPADNPLLLGAFVFLVALVFSPLQTRLRALVDRVFFRGRRASRERLAEFSHALTEAGDIPAIVAALHTTLADTVQPEAAHVFLADGESGEPMVPADVQQPTRIARRSPRRSIGPAAKGPASERPRLIPVPNRPATGTLATRISPPILVILTWTRTLG